MGGEATDQPISHGSETPAWALARDSGARLLLTQSRRSDIYQKEHDATVRQARRPTLLAWAW